MNAPFGHDLSQFSFIQVRRTADNGVQVFIREKGSSHILHIGPQGFLDLGSQRKNRIGAWLLLE